MAEYGRICPVCGKANKRSSSSCVNCGAKLISVIPVLIQGTDGEDYSTNTETSESCERSESPETTRTFMLICPACHRQILVHEGDTACPNPDCGGRLSRAAWRMAKEVREEEKRDTKSSGEVSSTGANDSVGQKPSAGSELHGMSGLGERQKSVSETEQAMGGKSTAIKRMSSPTNTSLETEKNLDGYPSHTLILEGRGLHAGQTLQIPESRRVDFIGREHLGGGPTGILWTNLYLGRQHCKIYLDHGGWYVVETGEGHPVFLDGLKVGTEIPRRLSDNSILQLGDEKKCPPRDEFQPVEFTVLIR